MLWLRSLWQQKHRTWASSVKISNSAFNSLHSQTAQNFWYAALPCADVYYYNNDIPWITQDTEEINPLISSTINFSGLNPEIPSICGVNPKVTWTAFMYRSILHLIQKDFWKWEELGEGRPGIPSGEHEFSAYAEVGLWISSQNNCSQIRGSTKVTASQE